MRAELDPERPFIDHPPGCCLCRAEFADAAIAAVHSCGDWRAPPYRSTTELLPDDAPRPVHVPQTED